MGVQREIDIIDLQPRHWEFRPHVISGLGTLGDEELLALVRSAEVWEIDGGKLISDGNHRLSECLRRGFTRVVVDYNELDDSAIVCFLDGVEDLIYDVQEARNRGVYSLADLWAV